MPRKPKTNQPQTPNEVQGRDFFQTPNYAVDLLIPYIPKNIEWVWEPACGDGKIVQRLTEYKLAVYPSDIRKSESWVDNHVYNFLTDENFNYYNYPNIFNFYKGDYAIITNPPFSLKYKFIYRALEYNVPFAFLIPFEMCQQLIDIFEKECQAIVPRKRIDYITPNTLERIHEGEVWKLIKNDYFFKNLNEMKRERPDIWRDILEDPDYIDVSNYDSIDETPTNLLVKYSTSQFHSAWLCYKFNLEKQLTFVELTKEMKENI